MSDETARARINGQSLRLYAWLAATLVLFGLFGKTAFESFRYERAQVFAGELWRLVSGHFVHGSLQHLIVNVAGLALGAVLFAREYRVHEWLAIIALSIAAIDLGFVFCEPQLAWYVGFSGVLHGMFAAGAVGWWRQGGTAPALALSLVLIGKLAWEQWRGALPLSGDLPVVVDAHLYGAIGGAAAAGLLWLRRQDWLSRRRPL